MPSSTEYDQLTPYHDDEKPHELPCHEEGQDEAAHNLLVTNALRRRLKLLGALLSISLLLNVLFAGYIFISALFLRDDTLAAKLSLGFSKSYVEWKGAKPVWSPAQDDVIHEYRLAPRFTSISRYHGNRTLENDKAWKDLYIPYTWSAISREESLPLLNRTERLLGDAGKYGGPRYAVGLEVFHQLHCLDMIRKKIYPAPPGSPAHVPPKFLPVPDPGDPPYDHIDHCINSVRESLMCSADITPNVWQWDPRIDQNRARIDVVHTCTNWDSLTGWAKNHKLKLLLNMTERAPDDWTRHPAKLDM